MKKRSIKYCITGNKYIDAIFLVMIMSASVHMMILVGYAVATQSFWRLNYFSILNADLLFPNVTKGTISTVLSFCIYTLLYIVAIWLYEKYNKD